VKYFQGIIKYILCDVTSSASISLPKYNFTVKRAKQDDLEDYVGI